MSSLRISIVQYLNTAPLVRGFTHGPLRGKYDLSFTVPSQCAEALRSSAADLAIIPAIEYQRIADLVLVPNLSIASKKAVRSLLLISRKPVNDVTRIALDRGSRSTQALTRILCRKLWTIEPQFFEDAPDLSSMLQKADAALLIGDPALRVSCAIEQEARRDASGAWTCPASQRWRYRISLALCLRHRRTVARADQAPRRPRRVGRPPRRRHSAKWCRIFSSRWRSACNISTKSAPRRQLN